MTAPAFPAVILAGGRSQRMGKDKALLLLGGKSLLERAVHRLTPQAGSIAINSNTTPPAFLLLKHIPVLADTVGGHRGPLAGILTAMRHAARLEDPPTHVATAAVDSPFFPLDLIARLSAQAGPGTIVTAAVDGSSHPVFGLWPVALADALEEWLGGDHLSVRGFLAHHPHVEMAFPALTLGSETLDPFFNVNTPEDFARAEAIESEFHP